MTNTQVVQDAFSLSDKVVVLTGAAGIIGSQIVKAFVEAGARVFAIDRDAALLEEKLGPPHQSLAVFLAPLPPSDSYHLLYLRNS